MRVLVTGASGALGGLVYRYLLSAQICELVYATSRSGLDGGGHLLCDLTEKNSVHDLLSKTRPNVIYHFSGSFTGDFRNDLNSNVVSTNNIFEAIKSLELKTRVVVCGSAAEYGMVLPDENPIAETQDLKPISIYGLTKAMQTSLCEYYHRIHKLDVVVARIFNLNIPDLSEKLFVGRVQASIKKYLAGDIHLFEFGNLDSYRDYVMVEQAIEQIVAIAANGIAGEVYNVGSGVPTKIRDLLVELLTQHGLADAPIVENCVQKSSSALELPVIFADLHKTNSLMK